jgi:hypothetical protein
VRVPVIDRTGEPAIDGNVPAGDGAEDRDEIDRASFGGEAVDPDGRDLAGADRVDTVASATVTALW